MIDLETAIQRNITTITLTKPFQSKLLHTRCLRKSNPDIYFISPFYWLTRDCRYSFTVKYLPICLYFVMLHYEEKLKDGRAIKFYFNLMSCVIKEKNLIINKQRDWIVLLRRLIKSGVIKSLIPKRKTSVVFSEFCYTAVFTIKDPSLSTQSGYRVLEF